MKKIIFLVIACILVSLTGNSIIQAQSNDDLLNMIDSNKFDQTKKLIESMKPEQKEETVVRYLTGLFKLNGEEAIQIYENLLQDNSNGQIRERVLWRMGQYYYLKGLYRQAGQFLNYLVQNFPQSKYAERARKEIEIIEPIIK